AGESRWHGAAPRAGRKGLAPGDGLPRRSRAESHDELLRDPQQPARLPAPRPDVGTARLAPRARLRGDAPGRITAAPTPVREAAGARGWMERLPPRPPRSQAAQ